MHPKRVAVIFDNTARPETTGVYCLNALRDWTSVEHVLPQDIARIARGAFDFYLNIDDGLRYRLPTDLRPCAWWVIDTHMDLAWAKEKGQDFDWVFAAQRDGAEQLCQAGIRTHWLPLACDPSIHRPHAVEKRWDACFIGRISAGPRQELLTLIRQQFPNSFIGQRYFDEFARTYSEARIGFNCSVKNDVNMRVFETLGCGTLLVTNNLRANGQEELLTSDKHLVTYRGPEELVDKLRFYLAHDDARERIALAGHSEAVARHTYRHRMQSLLETLAVRRPSVGRPSQAGRAESDRENNAGWVKPFRADAPAFDLARAPEPANSNETGILVRQRESARPALPIDFVIKTFLRPQALVRLLHSITEFYPAAHVTIADDGDLRESPDAQSRACCALIDANSRFVLHSLPFASGVTAGRNMLVDSTSRPYLLFLDDDFCFTAETRIERLWERLHLDPKLGMIAGSCIDVVDNERRPRNSGGTFEIQGDTLLVDTTGWRNRDAGFRDYVPQFALIRRGVFHDVRWEGGVGAEHYDFCLQLKKSRWKVAHDLSVRIDHHHFTPALSGYIERRLDYAAAQQWLLQKWNLSKIVQDGQTIVERQYPPPLRKGGWGGRVTRSKGSKSQMAAETIAI